MRRINEVMADDVRERGLAKAMVTIKGKAKAAVRKARLSVIYRAQADAINIQKTIERRNVKQTKKKAGKVMFFNAGVVRYMRSKAAKSESCRGSCSVL